MATMFKIKVNFSKIDKAKLFKSEKTGDLWGTITGCVNDEIDKYGNNVAGWFEQTKEEKEAKANRSFVGNGTAFWSDGKVTIVTKENPKGTVIAPKGEAVLENEPQGFTEENDNLPF